MFRAVTASVLFSLVYCGESGVATVPVEGYGIYGTGGDRAHGTITEHDKVLQLFTGDLP